MTSLPDASAHWTQLSHLELQNNKLYQLPDKINRLKVRNFFFSIILEPSVE